MVDKLEIFYIDEDGVRVQVANGVDVLEHLKLRIGLNTYSARRALYEKIKNGNKTIVSVAIKVNIDYLKQSFSGFS